MAEQRITVKLDPIQVQQLKDFVRDEIRQERQANMRVTAPPAPLRRRIEGLLGSAESTYEPADMIRADIVFAWLRGLLA